jgi:hypothetical protein
MEPESSLPKEIRGFRGGENVVRMVLLSRDSALCSSVGGYQRFGVHLPFYAEDGIVGNVLQDYTASQPVRP